MSLEIIGLRKGLGWRGPQSTFSSNPLLWAGLPTTKSIRHQIRLPRAPSNLAFNTSRDGRGIHSLSGQLFPPLTALLVKKVLLPFTYIPIILWVHQISSFTFLTSCSFQAGFLSPGSCAVPQQHT